VSQGETCRKNEVGNDPGLLYEWTQIVLSWAEFEGPIGEREEDTLKETNAQEAGEEEWF